MTMNQPVLIKLYFDQYQGLSEIPANAVVIDNAESYAVARQAIEKMKLGEMYAPLVLVVRSPRFFMGFHDLVLWGDLVQRFHIAPREEISRALHIQLHDSPPDRDLITLGVQKPADLLAVAGPQGIHDLNSFQDALLAKAFGSHVFRIGAFSSFETWLEAFLVFVYSEETIVRVGWRIEYVYRLVTERSRMILQQFEREDLVPFITDLVQRIRGDTVFTFLNQLVVRHWLSNYSKLACKAVIDNMTPQVGKWHELKGEASIFNVLTPWCEALYRQVENPLIERIEQALGLLLDNSDLIDEQDLSRFIARTSGRFRAEYDAVQRRLGKALLEQLVTCSATESRARFSSYLAQLDNHFTPLLQKTGQLTRNEIWVNALLEFNDAISHLRAATPLLWSEWLATYELLLKARQLKSRLRAIVPVLYAGQLEDLSVSFSMLDERLNSQFGDWLLNAYPRLLTSSTEYPPSVASAARTALDIVAKGARVILLVLDGLDWELWEHFRTVLGQHRFIVEGDGAGLALLPTITEFSRRAIFSGLSPRNMAQFVDDVYGTEIRPQEEAKTLARALGYLGRVEQLKVLPVNKSVRYLENELVYVSGGEKDFRDALKLDAKCYALVYTEIDSHIHKSKHEESKLKATVRQWLSDLAAEIAVGISQNLHLSEQADLKIIIASDHGFLDVSGQSQAEIEKSLTPFLDLERHGRLAIVKLNADASQAEKVAVTEAVKAFYFKHSADWHVIWQEHSEEFGLADSSPSEGEIVAWLMPRLFKYVNKGRGNYVHGGLSMYETIVPVATLARGEIEAEAPVVTLTGQLTSEEESELSIAVMNKNDRPLQRVTIDIPELGVADLSARDVGPNDVEKLIVAIIPQKSGDIPVRVVLVAEIGGVRMRFEEKRVIAVQPGRRERMRSSTRRTFEDEW